ncbi:PLP-dependent aminotransferase family protein [Streptomyces sp. NPDC014656]|uniref:aminotransferase-like domain-containing protein n=1 Tax=Streptomyces sp. NPDC014656 TaxID=3364878 RepID=UPI0036F70C57
MTEPSHARTARPGAVMDLADLHGSLSDPALLSMNLLNEVSERYPDAVSFAAGRPDPGDFAIEDVHRYLRTWTAHVAEGTPGGAEAARKRLYQYGRTKGVIQDLVARNLATDESIHADPESIVVTVGCQEAMVLVLRALRADDRDVLLTTSPAYVGITGAARLVDLPVVPVDSGGDGIDLADLAAKVRGAREAGLRPRACYLVPDFANPTGLSLDVPTRRRLLDLAAELDILLVEDNPYGFFGDGIPPKPTLKSMDGGRRVVYLGSYAKTALPGARIGYVVADQPVVRDGETVGTLADELSKIKSMITVNTPPIAQAVIGGRLLESGFALREANGEATARYGRRLRHLLDGLAARFPAPSPVTWNRPDGGFFLVVTVPFTADDELLAHSAARHKVIWTPMHHFYAAGGGLRQLRLSCSSLTPEEIDLGLDRFASLVTDLLERT